jgi:hypothetical protein
MMMKKSKKKRIIFKNKKKNWLIYKSNYKVIKSKIIYKTNISLNLK